MVSELQFVDHQTSGKFQNVDGLIPWYWNKMPVLKSVNRLKKHGFNEAVSLLSGPVTSWYHVYAVSCIHNFSNLIFISFRQTCFG